MAIILGIETSCDETAASVCKDGKILSNCIANQVVHQNFGGVVPELASRAHQQNIVPIVHQALTQAKIHKNELDAIAFTKGPGLLGSLLVGTSFSKAYALAYGIPLIEVNHLHAHVMANFILDSSDGKSLAQPNFPFLCLTVSGGHTQIVHVSDFLVMKVVGQTLDDAAGEAFDKTAKILGLPYPGGPFIDQYAQKGSPVYTFPEPQVPSLDFSFSGLKTAILYFIRDQNLKDCDFVKKELSNICASVQHRIATILISKLEKAAHKYQISTIALAGGVAANSGLRKALLDCAKKNGWKVFIPKQAYCTDNAAMVAISGYFKFIKGDFASQSVSADPRMRL